jgi:hypothetical protein
MATQANYSAEMTAQIISDYQNGQSVEDIAASVEKSVRSVRSKLVREGVYVATPKAKVQRLWVLQKRNCFVTLSPLDLKWQGLKERPKKQLIV